MKGGEERVGESIWDPAPYRDHDDGDYDVEDLARWPRKSEEVEEDAGPISVDDL